MARKDGYYAKKREVFNRQTRTTKIVYTPVIVVKHKEFMVSHGEDVIELDTRKEAEERAKKVYFEHREIVEKQLEEGKK